jgi:hypothetical protein
MEKTGDSRSVNGDFFYLLNYPCYKNAAFAMLSAILCLAKNRMKMISSPYPSPTHDTKSNPAKEAWIEDPNRQNGCPTMALFHSYDEDFIKTTEAQLRGKIDVRILPLVVLIYLFNYLDRNSITQARLYGLQEDTGLKGAQYQTAISIFSAGYIVMQLPSAMLMTKLRPSLYLVRSPAGS